MPKPLPVSLSPEVVAYLLEKQFIVTYPDNRSVVLYRGRTVFLNESQVNPWEVIYKNFLQGNLPISHKTIMAAWRGLPRYLYEVFFKHDPGWREILAGDRKGKYWLNIPEDILLEAERSIQQRATGMISAPQCAGNAGSTASFDRKELVDDSAPHGRCGLEAPEKKESRNGDSVSSNRPDPLRTVRGVLGYEVVSIKTAARFAGVSIAHLHRAAKGELSNTARLKVFRVGRRVLTRTDWLDEWMRSEPPSSPAMEGNRRW